MPCGQSDDEKRRGGLACGPVCFVVGGGGGGGGAACLRCWDWLIYMLISNENNIREENPKKKN
jgi:hypothetical protein